MFYCCYRVVHILKLKHVNQKHFTKTYYLNTKKLIVHSIPLHRNFIVHRIPLLHRLKIFNDVRLPILLHLKGTFDLKKSFKLTSTHYTSAITIYILFTIF